MEYLIIIAVAVISYLIGSVNFSIILSRALSGKDIRESGSGNAGATNMLRTHGKKMAIVTLLLDVAKGIVAVLLGILAAKLLHGHALPLGITGGGDGVTAAYLTTDYSFLKYIAAVCVVLGHNFPIFFGFKGGKGVATSLGVVLMLDWKVGLVIAVVAISIMAITKYVSLGSIFGGFAFIVAEIVKAEVTGNRNIIQLICVVILGGLLIARHHANIGRLIKGTENKLSFKK